MAKAPPGPRRSTVSAAEADILPKGDDE